MSMEEGTGVSVGGFGVTKIILESGSGVNVEAVDGFGKAEMNVVNLRIVTK